jgi:hypothetical protein
MSGKLHDTFVSKVTSLKLSARAAGDGLQQQGQVAWDTMDAAGVSGPGPTRFKPSYRDDFERAELETDYIAIYNSPDNGVQDTGHRTLADLRLNRYQAHWLAQVERDYLMRRRSRIRAEAHAASVRVGIGSDTGPVELGAMRYGKMLLAMAGIPKDGGMA